MRVTSNCQNAHLTLAEAVSSAPSAYKEELRHDDTLETKGDTDLKMKRPIGP